jgi:transcriptional antiterminator NusG
MMHDRTIDRAAARARRLKVRQVNPGELTAAQRARVEAPRPSFDDRMRAIRQTYLEDEVGPGRSDSPWYGLRVAFGREIPVENELKKHNVECLVPMRKGRERRVRHRIIAAKHEPAITGYVLVRFDPTPEACVGLMAVEHVVGLVSADGKPMPMDHEEVMKFKAKADDGSLDWERYCGLTFSKGERIEVTDGPFFGFTGTVVSARSDGRGDAVVELDLFGRPTPATLPLAILQKM